MYFNCIDKINGKSNIGLSQQQICNEMPCAFGDTTLRLQRLREQFYKISLSSKQLNTYLLLTRVL